MNYYETPLSGLRSKRDTVSALPKGLDFVRAGIAQALYPLDPDQRLDFVEKRYGENSRAARITKAVVVGLTTGAGAGDQLVGDEGAAAEFFDLVMARSVIGRLPLRRVPFHVSTLSMDEAPRVEWAGEGTGKRTGPLKLTRQTGLAPFKVATIIVSSNELLQQSDSGAEVLIRDQLVRALAVAVDAAFLDPTNAGTANVKPASITNAASAASGGSPMQVLGDIGALQEGFEGDPERAWILMHPHQAARLNDATRPNLGARGGSWAGYPVLTSTAVPDESFIMIDPDLVAVAMTPPVLRASTNALVDMQSSTTQSSVATVQPTTGVSMFQTDSTAILGEISANWRVIVPGAVQYWVTP